MKKLLILFTAIFCASFMATVEAQESSTVTWEAEKGTLESPVIKKTGTKYDKKPGKPVKNSGEGWIEIPNKANGDKHDGDLPGKAIFKVNVPASGQYTFWARTLWPNGCGNSFWIRIAERPNQLLGEDGTYDVWKWRKISTKLTLTKGVNTIIVANREDGVIMDECQITTSIVEPAGIVPVTPNALN
jgi:hypothetical protein